MHSTIPPHDLVWRLPFSKISILSIPSESLAVTLTVIYVFLLAVAGKVNSVIVGGLLVELPQIPPSSTKPSQSLSTPSHTSAAPGFID